MSNNPPKLFIFDEETLEAHDLNIAAKIHQATVASITRKMSRMNSGQSLNAARKHGESLYWSQEQLKTILRHIDD